MGRAVNTLLNHFNYGLASKKALARIDIKRTALAAEIQTNYLPRIFGAMSLRPGWGYVGGVRKFALARHIPFIFSSSDTAILELTGENASSGVMRVRVDEKIVARSSVGTASAPFGDNVRWAKQDEPGATSGFQGSVMALAGTKYASAIRAQEIAVPAADRGKEHGLRIVVSRGPVQLRIGTLQDGDDLFEEKTLRTGVYSIAFTPSSPTFFLRVASREPSTCLIDSIAIEGAGIMEIPTPWAEADLDYVRRDQSGDVIFCACRGRLQRRIERYGIRSWGIAQYEPTDGPFRLPNTTQTKLSFSGLNGDVDMASSAAIFKPGHVGALFRITSIGQNVDNTITGGDQWTDSVRITGVSGARAFNFTISGGASYARIILQRSVTNTDSWQDTGTVYTADGSYQVSDTDDNSIYNYRLGVRGGDFGSGAIRIVIGYQGGGKTGIVRITEYRSPTACGARVIKPLGAGTASEIWAEGAWSSYRGFPTATAIYDGRCWWAGKDRIDGSQSDAYEGFSSDVTGDSGPIARSIGAGPVDNINFLLALLRLIVGTDVRECTARSSSFDEPLTPTAFSLKSPSTRGSSPVDPVTIDSNGFFVRNGSLYKLAFGGDSSADYGSEDMTILCPEVGESDFRRLATQRRPDTRIHAVRKDGKVALMVFDQAEDIQCWVILETDGFVEDAFTLPDPSGAEDRVYYSVRRVVGGQTVRYLERWAKEKECTGGTVNRLADSHLVVHSDTPTKFFDGFDHLEGEQVVVWGDGRDLGTVTVSSGRVVTPENVSTLVAGLGYTARYKSVKLAYASSLGTAIGQKKNLSGVSLVLADTHALGLRYGQAFDVLDDMPGTEEGGEIIDPDRIWEDYDYQMTEIPFEWKTDSRICLESAAPRPATILALVVTLDTNDRV